MGIGVLLLASVLTGAAPDTAGALSEAAFLAEAQADARVRALLGEPLAEARAERARAGAFENPQLAFEREALDGQPRQETWSVSWTPPLDGRTFTARRAGEAALAAAGHRHALSQLELRGELRETYADWALAAEAAAFGHRLAGHVSRLARQAGARAARGEASMLTSRRLALARVEVGAETARLEADLARAHGRAKSWLAGAGRAAAPTLPPLPPVPADSSLWSRSPRLAALEQELRRAEALRGLSARFWALPELTVGRQELRGPGDAPGGPVFGVRWGLPVFDRAQGDRIESRGRLDAAPARLELERVRARERFAAAVAAYAVLRAAAADADGAEADAERVLTSATAVYEAGESDLTDLLESLRGALGGRLAALDARAAALRAHRELELAAGTPLPLTEGDAR